MAKINWHWIGRHQRLLLVMGIWLSVSLFYVSTGASGVSIADIFLAAFGQLDDEQSYLVRSVLVDIRLPRYAKCVLTGAAMAAAGVLTQGLFRNSLAAPSVLGVSSGAGLLACLVYFSGLYLYGFWVLPLASVAGSLLIIILLLLFMRAFSVINREAILLTGFAINILCGAMITLIVSLSLETPKQTPALMHWLMGDFSYPLTTYIWFCFAVLSTCIFLALKIGPYLEAFILGDEVVRTLAIDPQKVKYIVLLLVAVLVGFSVSMVGAVPFVGLIIPHVLRYLFGPHIRRLLLYSTVVGATFVLVADLLARALKSPGELQTGILLALVGAPFFIFVMVWQRRGAIDA